MATAEETSDRRIRRIDRGSVHRICSGQVIVNMAVAIKELVENALDAEATNIEIRLKEYGAESIEVIDNGHGVEEKDFQNLTVKHCTSKLKEFDDLISVETFGFRGEALSSLCALSNLSIITCHEKAANGTSIEYDHSGNITKKAVCSRQAGTTVRILDLFSTLPVRHKEFLKNVKRDFTKAIHILHGYCLIATDKRIVCTNQVGKTKNVVVTTRASRCSRGSILDTFGSKQLDSVIEIKQCSPSADVLEEYSLKETTAKDDFFQIHGFVSVSTHGQGRCASDRQFCSINGRPCDLQKVTKVVNEVYRNYNKNQYPFLWLDVTLKKDSVDLNVTPDKRQIFIENETLLLAIIKTSLIALYEPRASQLGVSCPMIMSNGGVSCFMPSQRSENLIDRSANFSRFKRDFLSLSQNGSSMQSPVTKQPRLDSFVTRIADDEPNDRDSVSESKEKTTTTSTNDCAYKVTFSDEITALARSKQTPNELKDKMPLEILAITDDAESELRFKRDSSYSALSSLEGLNTLDDTCHIEPAATGLSSSSEIQCDEIDESQRACSKQMDFPASRTKIKVVTFSMDELRQKFQRINVLKAVENAEESVRKFRSKIDPSANQDAERELSREIHRHMFPKMDIIGQFNLGFIIAKLKSDLFIIDQHATDEKFNFETLQKNTILETQKLISPQSLNLTVASEMLLIENLNVFRMNGFEFEIDMQADAGHRIRLVSIPVSKNWVFGTQDIDEMLFMLSDSPPGVMCRPSRVQQMFASRACRKSVMIGTPLAHNDMKKLVCHMGEMDQPWNCPHGRPTMRHLVSLHMI